MPIPPPPPSQSSTLNPANLRVLKLLGKGATGTVLLVYDSAADPSASSPFALKLLQNPSSTSTRRRLLHESSILSLLSSRPNPFLPSLLGNLLDCPDLLAFSLPFCPGGDLHLLRYRLPDRVFSPSSLRFYLAEIVSALHHLHSLGIAYRDLKPENLLIQRSGHLTLTDFDLSKHLPHSSSASPPPLATNRSAKPRPASKINFSLKKATSARVSPVSRRRQSLTGKSFSFVGTEEYVAPEVVRGDGHGFAVDWWALGVLTYEMSYGKTPFKGKSKKETFRNVLYKPVECPGKRTALTDLIERLLAKDPAKRLGYCRGADEIKEHEFFRGVQWDLLTEVVRPPFIPSREDELDGGKLTASSGIALTEFLRKLREPPPSGPPSLCERRTPSLTEN